MPRIENDVKLDFKDVLLRPKRSTLKSRNEVGVHLFLQMDFICSVLSTSCKWRFRKNNTKYKNSTFLLTRPLFISLTSCQCCPQPWTLFYCSRLTADSGPVAILYWIDSFGGFIRWISGCSVHELTKCQEGIAY